ncbi:hypothetical protein TNCV_4689311 [Trichonephila clavipes]|nr:hypothetical protein TNCV_4689311 [Trichonephila clavipes]
MSIGFLNTLGKLMSDRPVNSDSVPVLLTSAYTCGGGQITSSIQNLLSRSKPRLHKETYLAQRVRNNPSAAMGSLVVRASDSRLEGLGSIPDATKYPPSTYGVRAR